ncbi:hypothetical protein BEP19_01325 [Ammoniphilus oxalaticus]|uniref:Copper amine oxidase-like N-terminal domain-containing protein n=1 Tax=Ammoniphilus oxalaticus TaxID=66863 RepID=A0A419SMZ1_9BACL|nr:stalk domain-containing protein [Ammoniphilus oxalaticus]RKD25612.1 hypothetical protein BEP19_01325 [Ammoniphilus oxalaticus]
MKKLLSLSMTLALLTSFAMSPSVQVQAESSQQPTPIKVAINGNQLELENDPVVINGQAMVPVRAIFEKLGAQVSWDDAAKTITAVKGMDQIRMTQQERSASKNNINVILEAPPVNLNGRVFAPVRFLSVAFGATVVWDDANRTVTIETKEKTPIPDDPQSQEIAGLADIWATALQTRDGKPRYEMMSAKAKEKFELEQIARGGEDWNFNIGVSSPWVVEFDIAIEGMTAEITYLTQTSNPAFYETKEKVIFTEDNGRFVVDDYQTILEDALIE